MYPSQQNMHVIVNVVYVCIEYNLYQARPKISRYICEQRYITLLSTDYKNVNNVCPDFLSNIN